MDLLLAVVIVVGIATAGKGRESEGYKEGYKEDIKASILGGGMAMVCLNCMSIPLCLVGVGLAVVGLVAHRESNHLFTWIGLLGNGVVIVTMLGLYILGSMMGK